MIFVVILSGDGLGFGEKGSLMIFKIGEDNNVLEGVDF